MKRIFSFIAAMMITGSIFAQRYVILVKPAGAKSWGYCDLKGNMIIEPQFRKCIGFSEDGYAAIYDGKAKEFYFIDLNGNRLNTDVKGYKLIEIFSFGMKGFNDGFAPVKIGDKWGFLNTDGKLAIEAKYEKVVPFNDGFTSVMRAGQYYVLDAEGNEYPVMIPGVVDLNEFSEQLASFRKDDKSVGFVDGSGRDVIKAQFQSAGDFHDGMAWAKNSNGNLGYIDTKGEWVIQPKYSAGKDFDPVSGLARIKSGDRWGYVDKSGQEFYIPDSEIFEDFNSGLARGRKDDKFGFFNANMKWAIEPQFDGARDFKNGYASVKEGELWGVIDTAGNWVIQPKFDDIKDVEVVK